MTHTSGRSVLRPYDLRAPAAGRPGVLGIEPSAAGATVRLTSGSYTLGAAAAGAESTHRLATTAPSRRETP